MPDVYDNDYVNSYQQQKINYFLLLRGEAFDTAYIWTVNSNQEATLLYYIGNKQVIKVPPKIGGYDVKYIAPTCYNGLNFIKSISIPEGVIAIQ